MIKHFKALQACVCGFSDKNHVEISMFTPVCRILQPAYIEPEPMCCRDSLDSSTRSHKTQNSRSMADSRPLRPAQETAPLPTPVSPMLPCHRIRHRLRHICIVLIFVCGRMGLKFAVCRHFRPRRSRLGQATASPIDLHQVL
jgi:hypothetical protein